MQFRLASRARDGAILICLVSTTAAAACPPLLAATRAIQPIRSGGTAVLHPVELPVSPVPPSEAALRVPGAAKRIGFPLVSLVAAPDAAGGAPAGIRCAARDLDLAPDTLAVIAERFACGELSLPVERHVPLGEAASAQELNRAGRTRGKIVLDVRADAGDRTSAH